MKRIFSLSLVALLITCITATNANADAITPKSKYLVFNPGITPAPSVVIPFAPIKTEVVSVADAVKEFKNLSKADKKARIKQVKAEIKEFKKQKRADNSPSTNTLLLVILALLLPPLAVYLHEGEINNKFWISLILTLLFFLPGVIYALVVVLGKD